MLFHSHKLVAWLVVGVFFFAGMGWRYLARPDQRENPSTSMEPSRSVIDARRSAALDDPHPTPSLREVFEIEPVFRPPLLVRHLAEADLTGVQEAFEKLLDLSPASRYERARDSFLDSLYDYVFLRWIECDPLDGWSHVHPLGHDDLTSRYLALWSDRDPEAAVATLTRRERFRYLKQIVESSSRRDPRQALALFFANEDTWSGHSISDTIIEAVGRHCPERFPELADRARRLGGGSARKVARAWARAEPERALEWADTLYPLQNRRAAQAAVYGAMAEADPESVKNLIDGMPKGTLRTQATIELSRALAESDISEALDLLRDLPYDDERNKLLRDLRLSGKTGDAFQTIDLFVEHGLFISRDLAFEAASDLAKENPQAAVTFLERIDGSLSNDQWAQLMQDHDPVDLAKHVQGISSARTMQAYLTALCKRWVTEDFGEAKAFVARLGNTPEGLLAALAIAQSGTSKDPEGMLAWAKSLPEEISETATREVFHSLVGVDPDLAYAQLDQLADPDSRRLGIERLVTTWSWNDAAAAIDLLNELPEEERERHYSSLAYKYVHIDPQATSEWIAELPPGKGRDAAIGQMIRGLTYGPRGAGIRDFEGAFYWGQVIGSDTQRIKSLRNTVSIWKRTNPSAAYDALEKAELPEAEKAALYEIFEQ